MARPSRKQESRSTNYPVYKPPSSLEIPEEMVEHFKNEGFHLRWIRFLVNGQEDYQNITKRIREGYEFVARLDVPEQFQQWFQTAKVRNINQAICVGDLVLGKIKTELAKARQDYFEGKSVEQVKAARREAGKTSDKRMDTMVPIVDESESEVEIT